MNFTDSSRTRTLFVIPHDSSPSGWKGYVIKATVLAVGVGTYILFFRKDFFLRRRWCLRRQKKEIKDNSDVDSTVQTISSGPIIAYNREICPICLGAPKIGVRAPCGHLLCADCLASYCDVRIAPAPPPCPLCRAPLDSVALACDFAIVSAETGEDNELNIDANIRTWIQEYNLHRGLIAPGRTRNSGFLTKRVLFFVNILKLVLIIGLIVSRIQILQWTGWIACGSVIDVILGIALMTCVWFKWHEQQATLNYE